MFYRVTMPSMPIKIIQRKLTAPSTDNPNEFENLAWYEHPEFHLVQGRETK